MAMKAGDLRIWITLMKPTGDRDAGLRRGVTFEDFRSVPAARRDVSGKEFFEAHAVHAEDIVTWTIRFRKDIDTTWRIRHRETVYDILEINTLGYMQDYLQIKSRAVKPGGR